MPLRSSAADDTDKPVLVYMQAALDIDRDGQVTAVTFVDDSKLPVAIRKRGEQMAKSWKFLPPTKDGKAVGGRTYARMQACIVPNDAGIDFTVTNTGNGPASFFRAARKLKSTALPVSKLMGQGFSRLHYTITYRVSVRRKTARQFARTCNRSLNNLMPARRYAATPTARSPATARSSG